MRTSDFSFFVSSSIVFQRPAGEVACANAETAAPASRRRRRGGSLRKIVMVDASGQNRAASKSIIGAAPARAVRMSDAVSGSSLAK